MEGGDGGVRPFIGRDACFVDITKVAMMNYSKSG